MIIIQQGPLGMLLLPPGIRNLITYVLERTPSGKLLKVELRKVAQRHWEDRHRNGTSRDLSTNL